MVVEVMANGNLVIIGEKQLALTEGSEFIQVKGIIRPADIQPDNTVLSQRIAHAQISYRGTGELAFRVKILLGHGPSLQILAVLGGVEKLLCKILKLLVYCYWASFTFQAQADRIKDLTDVAGVRSNQLIGFGLVSGLSGSGDGKDLPITAQALKTMLSGMGVSVDGPVTDFDLGTQMATLAAQNAKKEVKVENLAAVMVTA
jgi:hypothetical protein